MYQICIERSVGARRKRQSETPPTPLGIKLTKSRREVSIEMVLFMLHYIVSAMYEPHWYLPTSGIAEGAAGAAIPSSLHVTFSSLSTSRAKSCPDILRVLQQHVKHDIPPCFLPTIYPKLVSNARCLVVDWTDAVPSTVHALRDSYQQRLN